MSYQKPEIVSASEAFVTIQGSMNKALGGHADILSPPCVATSAAYEADE